MWVAVLPRPALPLSEIHKAIWGYFPEAADGDARPFLWRPLEGDRVAILSRLKPACPAVLVRPESGRVYGFEVLLKTELVRGRKNRGPGRLSKPGQRIALTDNAGRKAWLCRNLAGADATFVQFYDRPPIELVRSDGRRLTIPVAIARGTLHVRERAAFAAFLCAGGPGSAKVYGCGMWWLPELMAPAIAALPTVRCAA